MPKFRMGNNLPRKKNASIKHDMVSFLSNEKHGSKSIEEFKKLCIPACSMYAQSHISFLTSQI